MASGGGGNASAAVGGGGSEASAALGEGGGSTAAGTCDGASSRLTGVSVSFAGLGCGGPWVSAEGEGSGALPAAGSSLGAPPGEADPSTPSNPVPPAVPFPEPSSSASGASGGPLPGASARGWVGGQESLTAEREPPACRLDTSNRTAPVISRLLPLHTYSCAPTIRLAAGAGPAYGSGLALRPGRELWGWYPFVSGLLLKRHQFQQRGGCGLRAGWGAR